MSCWNVSTGWGGELSPYTEKLVFSFVDMYHKTAAALRRLDPAYRAPTVDEMRELARASRPSTPAGRTGWNWPPAPKAST